MTTKQCSWCKQEFPSTNEFFNRRLASKDGLNYLCRDCQKKQNKDMKSKSLRLPETTDVVDVGVIGAVGFKLKQGVVVLIDDCDKDLSSYRWSAAWDKKANSFYVSRQQKIEGKLVGIKLHRVIMSRVLGRELTSSEIVDHINNSVLDDRRCNLRIATKAQNNQNSRLRGNNKSGYKGVHYANIPKKWVAQISKDGKRKWLGAYDNAEDAYTAYCEAAKIEHGEFANFGNKPVCPDCNDHRYISIKGDEAVNCERCNPMGGEVIF